MELEEGRLTFDQFIEQREEPLMPEIRERLLVCLEKIADLGKIAVDKICFSTWMWTNLIAGFSPLNKDETAIPKNTSIPDEWHRWW